MRKIFTTLVIVLGFYGLAEMPVGHYRYGDVV
jgi:hypothetical protein